VQQFANNKLEFPAKYIQIGRVLPFDLKHKGLER